MPIFSDCKKDVITILLRCVKNNQFRLIAMLLLLPGYFFAHAQTNADEVPMIGAEVFIEPGQTPEEIDGWFRVMKENGMTITRIRMFESYMHLPDGSWNFSLFDQAFKAGEKYGIKIYANLFPATAFTDVGGFKFPKDDENLAGIATYIRQIVNHFKQFSSLYGWVPVNEPGNGGIPNDAFSKRSFTQWKNRQVSKTNGYNSNGYPVFDFAEQRFLLYYNTWFLDWLVTEIHKYDPGKPVHVNNHNIFHNAAEYDFPQWRQFLTSLGGSAHASWHFDYFTRQQYALAMDANSELLRSGAGNIPWLMTEIQGGNNTYSGGIPLCPTKEETAQWLWTIIAAGGKGSIFWCLNPRGSGFEAGEWALLDYQDNPSDRMLIAASVAKVIQQNSRFFSSARVAESGISVLYTRESMWVEKKLQTPGAVYAGRAAGGVMKSALGYFEALAEMGVQANLKEISEFDFSANDYAGKAIILSHQISIPSKYWPLLENFVAKGGKLMVDGLTAYYDENAHCILRKDFPLKKLLGGSIGEYKIADTLFNLQVAGITLPATLWRGTLLPGTGRQQGTCNGEVTAISNTWGKGKVLWAPSLLGLGSRLEGNYSGLCKLLVHELQPVLSGLPLQFSEQQPNMFMKVLQSGKSYLAVVINKSTEKRTVRLQTKLLLAQPVVLFANGNGKALNNEVEISPEETMVLSWEGK